ncbi:hydroxyisourate hydrolase [Synechococcus sp. PCC 7335]|uniref:hydroxyisourate hydrolase n=1 Tax=Synechococcus sp. (strain ATCC 29403 / PCC 7335) TaxID=91464 RepID=UPI00017EB451|nr:hydroxyisourate hydrolase [Synechococcus sp. PCC 7335]EDX83707.1 hydroxyisourate hydrolase [Synechococcus sp. PCC 7335]
MEGKLTTHVLDTANGCPAAGMTIELWKLEENRYQKVSSHTTNADGRTDSPLLIAEAMITGNYELLFMAGDYFAQQTDVLPTPPFLDIIPIRFGIAEATSHYHVPLLASPWSYSTYRGS